MQSLEITSEEKALIRLAMIRIQGDSNIPGEFDSIAQSICDKIDALPSEHISTEDL